jgi:hypothetical protein
MKKFILILLVTASISSCKDFLEEQPVTRFTQEYYNTEGGLESLITGLYVYARVKHEWDAVGTRLIEPETDAYMTSNIDMARFNSSGYGTDVSTIAGNVNNFIGARNDANNAPLGAYPTINNCNIALDILENVKPGKFGTDQSLANTRRGEILFLRSWAYYLISNQLGAVPLLLTANRQDPGVYYFPKASLEEIYTRIIADVHEAYQLLPLTQSDRGRATRLAAGHFLAKLYLNRAQAAGFQGSGEQHLAMLYKGNVSTDLDSCISIATDVINAGGALAPDYWTLFDPRSQTNPHSEILWAAQFDINTTLNGRFGNRSVNYHTGNYTDATGVARAMAYGRPFGSYKPTDWAYDNFHDKVNDSRYYKTFMPEYISNMPPTTTNSFRWTDASAAWWNANKPAGEPAVVKETATQWERRVKLNKRALIYIENQKDEALDSATVLGQPFQFMVRWVRSAKTGNYYYRLFYDGSNMGLATGRTAPYLSSRKWVDPTRGGSSDEANFDSEAGTRDAILMRLAETYLIRAEAYGRKGDYASAVNDINVLRKRASYKPGETRSSVAAEWEPQAVTLAPSERLTPFAVAADSYNAIMVTENHFTPGTPEATAEKYIPSLSSKEEMFIHFIYNEKAREFLSEGLAWEDLHNAGILYDRVIHFNQMASSEPGLWPVATNTANGNGQDGNGKGKGQYKKHHTFRPWPNAYLILLTDEKGSILDAAGRAAYQNPGY